MPNKLTAEQRLEAEAKCCKTALDVVEGAGNLSGVLRSWVENIDALKEIAYSGGLKDGVQPERHASHVMFLSQVGTITGRDDTDSTRFGDAMRHCQSIVAEARNQQEKLASAKQ